MSQRLACGGQHDVILEGAQAGNQNSSIGQVPQRVMKIIEPILDRR